jgi:polysaccharide export outer membrane protein
LGKKPFVNHNQCKTEAVSLEGMAPVRVARAFRLPIITAMTALALSGCVHTTSPVATAQPRSDLDAMAYGQPAYYPAPMASAAPPANSGGAIAALNASLSAPRRAYAQPQPAQYAPPQAAYAAAPMPVAYDVAYRLDAGDKLRVVVYGQEGLTNSYAIDAGGSITMPLIGSVPARGRTPAGLASEITGRLRNGYIRDPSVAVEIESYRPFFILGEVAAPGQYPYVPNMSVESAVAIAGGFSPRAKRDRVTLTHTDSSGSTRYVVPLGTAISPGDTVLVGERWF